MSGVAFVTGVSRGLGAALAAQLLAAGWVVFGVGRSAAQHLAGPRFEWVHADLADVDAANLAVQSALRMATMRIASMPGATAPPRALLINNAAVAGPVGALGRLAGREIVASLAVNLAAPTVLANAFCNAFSDTRVERRIINVTSGLAGRAIAGASLYSIAKSGMEMLTRALAVDHPEASFAAVTLRPGIIDTDMQVYLRGRAADELPDVGMFQDFHDSGGLVSAERVAQVAIAHLVDREVESGSTYNYAELASASASSAGVATSRSAPASSSRDP